MNKHFQPEKFESSTPFSEVRIEAAAVYCSDGRFGEQCDDLLVNGLDLPRYDRLAIPGGSACLAGHFATYREEEGAVEELKFLVEAHRLQRVVLIAHEDCAFYTKRLGTSPLQLESQQRIDMEKAVNRVRRMGSHLIIDAYFARKRDGAVLFERVM